MKLISQGYRFKIEDVYAEYSPFFRKILETEIPVEMMNGYIVMDELADPKSLLEYLMFLQGLEFLMNDQIEDVFDILGHENRMQYPIDVFKMKLQDNWIRDNFYKYRLYEDPYYGLVELPIVRELKMDDIPIKSLANTEYIIAGGAALYMAGYTPKYSDIDLFFICDKLKAEEIIQQIFRDNKSRDYMVSIGDHVISIKERYQIKRLFILRTYTCPSEVIHGFDVDCVGILYDGKKLWCTKRTLLSLQLKMNWFDPSRSSPSYAYRLCKYRTRGFEIYLPLFDPSRINEASILEIYKFIASIILNPTEYVREHMNLWYNELYLVDEEEDEDIDIPYDVYINIRGGDYDINISLYGGRENDEVEKLIDQTRRDLYQQIDKLLHNAQEQLEEKFYELSARIKKEKRNLRLLKFKNNFFYKQISEVIDIPEDSVEYLYKISLLSEIKDTDHFWSSMYIWTINYLIKKDDPRRESLLNIIPQDPVSIMIMSNFFNFFSSRWKKTDYGIRSNNHIYFIDNSFDLQMLKGRWITQNPMSLISSTIYPTPIDDIEEWYSRSSLYI